MHQVDYPSESEASSSSAFLSEEEEVESDSLLNVRRAYPVAETERTLQVRDERGGGLRYELKDDGNGKEGAPALHSH